jgi:high-affinity Fe2+/Pb2+ permease
MTEPELDRLIKEKMRRYVPDRPIQVMHGGVIVLVSIAIGILTLPAGEESAGAARQGLGAWLGVYLAVGGLILYVVWTHLRANKARKEANEEYLVLSQQMKK